jgi:excisionase family DNA binding protein
MNQSIFVGPQENVSANAGSAKARLGDHAPQAVFACFVLPPEQADKFLSLLREITQGPVIARPSNGSETAFAPMSQSNTVWLTHAEAAGYLGVAVSTLYRYAEQERIECRKIGNRLEYRRSSLDRFKEQQIRPARCSRSRGIITPTLDSGN